MRLHRRSLLTLLLISSYGASTMMMMTAMAYSTSFERDVIPMSTMKRRLEIMIQEQNSNTAEAEEEQPMIRNLLLSSSARLRTPSLFQHDQHHRKRKLDTPCDAAFLKCLPSQSCLMCFEQLGENDIDWAGVSGDTPCSDVTDLLTEAGHCTTLKTDPSGKDAFCDTFNSCVIWDDDKNGGGSSPGGKTPSGEGALDCNELKKCDWEGIHKNFLGDGICQFGGCYNTEVCNWDNGDCCEDTCTDHGYNKCGVDGYECRDPKSKECIARLNPDCDNPSPTPAPKPPPECLADEDIYILNLFDSWGDGWDLTKLTLGKKDTASSGSDGKFEKVVYEGSLMSGYEGSEQVCLGKGCYNVKVTDGLWGNEVSWEVRPKDGGTNLAFGGSAMDCTFPIGGNACDNTCKGKETDNSSADITDCINSKCLIQLGTCTADDDCSPCLVNDSPKYCFTNDKYNALVDCAICKCTDEDMEAKIPEYCADKGGGGIPSGTNGSGTSSSARKCTAPDTLKGSSAVLQFAKCSDIDGADAMMTEWSTDNFGHLDLFEDCAHTYASDSVSHGGKSPGECMNLLAEIINGETDDPEYVKSIATHVYKTPQNLCDCSSEANKDCPACDQFTRFKTLLAETLDACNSLDMIDCPAWDEFAKPCKDNVVEKFTSVDFSKREQCDYAESGCDTKWAFPAFRRLDCGKEISKSSWDFYQQYSKNCKSDDPPSPSGGNSTPSPTPQPAGGGGDTPATPRPTPKEVDPADKPKYIPPADDPYFPGASPTKGSSSSQSKAGGAGSSSKAKKGFLWIMFLGATAGGAYFLYKKRRESSFGFVRYHRQPQGGMERDDMALGRELFGGMSTGSFEPVSVPTQPGPV